MTARTAGWAWIALAILSCGGHSRFALRAPLWHVAETPLSDAPAEDEEEAVANTVDVTLLRPLSRGLLFEVAGEAHDVNALDEVPSSSWFTNRIVSPSEVELGPCPVEEPAPPFTIRGSKPDGASVGFVVEDAAGTRYLFKLEQLPLQQPEIGTAADAIVSRLYWAAGFNAPCNRVLDVDRSELIVGAESTERLSRGRRRPLTERRLAQILAQATHRDEGPIRVGASRFIEGEPIGTWRTEGVRADDPNDVIPHEDRRELRGERLLAAWVEHWDSRGPQSFDAFVRGPDGSGLVVHYFLDFSDSLGALGARTEWPEPRLGHTTVSNVPAIAVDIVGLGFVRRPWDEVWLDPRYPNLGFFDVEHFDPMGFAPQTPQVRWARAQQADLAWMARRLARLGRAHVRAAVRAGRLTSPEEEARLVDVLMGRRRRILSESFRAVSPLADPEMVSAGRFCADDLGISTGITPRGSITYELALRAGARLDRASIGPAERSLDSARVCAELPSFAARSAAEADRYATLDVIRVAGGARTVLRAHFYELPSGYVLVGIERDG